MKMKEWFELMRKDWNTGTINFDMPKFEEILEQIKKHRNNVEVLIEKLKEYDEFEVGFVWGYVFAKTMSV